MSLNEFWKIIQHKDVDAFRCQMKKVGVDVCGNLFRSIHKKSGDHISHMLARHGGLEMLRVVREEYNLPLELVNLDGKTPLHEASANGHVGVVAFLLSQGVSVDPLKRAGWTPLMMACAKRDNIDVVTLLVKAGANVHLVNKDGWNPFHIACRAGDMKVLTFLHDLSPAIWDTASTNGRTPLHTAALHGMTGVVDFLLTECGARLDSKDACGSTAFMDSVRSGNESTMEVFLRRKPVSLRDTNKMGQSCLHVAAEANQTTSIMYLCENYSLNINLQVSEDNMCKGQTPLHFAYKDNNTEAIETLLELGADDTLRDYKGRKPKEMFVKRTWSQQH